MLEGEPDLPEEEAAAAEWLTRDEELARADAGLQRLIEKGFAA